MLCDKFPTFHSSKNTTEPKELTGQTISLIAFDSSYQGQIRGFEETLENKTAVEHMLQQELETLENELNVVKETAIGELLETSTRLKKQVYYVPLRLNLLTQQMNPFT